MKRRTLIVSTVKLLHGSDHIIKTPQLGLGRKHNDYGRGFYCTQIPEMAREWACKNNADGFVNEYSFNTKGLKVINLFDGNYTVLNWIGIELDLNSLTAKYYLQKIQHMKKMNHLHGIL